MIASDELIVVTTPDHVTLNSTMRAVKIAKDRRTPIIGIILNKVYGKDFEIPLEDIEKVSGCNVLAVLPHEIQVVEALSKCVPSTLYKDTDSTIEFRKLAASLLGEEYKTSKFKRFFGKFFSRVPKQDVNRVIFRKTRLAPEMKINVPEI